MRTEFQRIRICYIVDDCEIMRSIFRYNLESMNFQCVEAENGAAASQLCETSLPDLIVLDCDMPVMNGIEFLSHLQRTYPNCKPKVIFCTATQDEECIKKAKSMGVDYYLRKPIAPDNIMSVVKAVLN